MFHEREGRPVFSVAFGQGDPTVVGVAGAFANWEIWVPLFEHLSPRHRVVAFDHDGVGETKTSLSELTHEARVGTLFSVLDHRDVDRCVLLGDSNNASVAVDAVVRSPERFAGLVVVSGDVGGFDRPSVRRFVEGLRSDFAATIDFFVAVVFPEDDVGHLKQWLRDIIVRTGPDAAAAILESYYELDLRPALAQVQVPALVIHGGRDLGSETARADAEALASALPDATLHVLEDAGHLPLLSRPGEVAALVTQFIAGLR